MKFFLILSYTLLNVALSVSNGHYHKVALGILVSSFVCFVLSLCCRRSVFLAMWTRKLDSTWPLLVGLSIVVMLGRSWYIDPGIYVLKEWYVSFYKWFFFLSFITSIALFFYALLRRAVPVSIVRFLFPIAALASTVLYIGMPIVSEANIDVYTVQQHGISTFLQGENPYNSIVPKTYGWEPNLPGYVYPPINLLIQIPSYIVTGDVRFFSAISYLFFAFILFFIVRKSESASKSWLIAFLALFALRGLFVVEQAWTEIAAVIPLSIAVLLSVTHTTKGYLQGVLLGLFMGSKQYLIFYAIHYFQYARWNWKRAAGVFGGVLVPAAIFYFWNSEAFVQNGFMYNLNLGFRVDSLNIAVYHYELYGRGFSTLMSLGVGLGCSVGTTILFWRRPSVIHFLYSSSFTLFAIFLFGKQAFCNYYFLVQMMLLLLIAVLIHEKDYIGSTQKKVQTSPLIL